MLASVFRFAIVFAALPVAALAAEGGCGERTPVPAPECSDPGTPIRVSPGDVFTLVLESNRTTGYRWELASPSEGPVARLLSSEYRPTPPQRIGSGGREYWRFEAVAAGEASISFRYVRPWEKSKAPAREAQFHVTVAPVNPGTDAGQPK